MLATLDAPVYIERVALGDNKLIARADKAIQRAIENQVKGLGFSLVEVLSPCPTCWKMEPVAAQLWVRDVMTKTYPLQVFRDRTRESGVPAPPPAVRREPTAKPPAVPAAEILPPLAQDLQIRVAGFGGQGVLVLGEILAEAGLAAGSEVSWLPSYGPEMRSGTSNCHVRISRQAIDSPLVTYPDVLFAMNEPSLRKFAATVAPRGWIVFNGETVPAQVVRPDVHLIARNFTAEADLIGGPNFANVVMLGAWIAACPILSPEHAISGLRRLVKNLHVLAIDRRALERGAELLQEGANHGDGTEARHDCVLR
jgi:2-oxoisovalerate ferredoxin oxidoreductase beta subunit